MRNQFGKFIDHLLFSMPEGSFWNSIKLRVLEKKGFIEDINAVSIFKMNEYVKLKGKIRFMGSYSINRNVLISSSPGGTISLGHNILIGPNAVIRNADHGFASEEPMIKQEKVVGDIVIDRNVWIASNVVITRGVIIAEGVIVGAGSIVTKSCLEPYSLYAGAPAKWIKYLKN